MKRRSNILATIMFIMSLSPLVFPQTDSSAFYPDTGVVILPPAPIDSSKLVKDIVVMDTLSSTPTLKEITKLFLMASEKRRDPFIVATIIANKKDNAIPALQDFLYTPVVQPPDSLKSGSFKLNKQFAIYALEEIFTAKSIELLVTVSINYPDKEIRGLAVKALASDCFNRVKYDSLQPDKELLRALLANAEDATFVQNCESRIDEIAKSGIKNWTGLGYKDFLNASNTKSLINSYRYAWWQNNSGKIKWDADRKQFIVLKN